MLKVWRAGSTLVAALVVAVIGQIAFYLLGNVPLSFWLTGLVSSWFHWGFAASIAIVLWLLVDARPTAIKAFGVVAVVFAVQAALVIVADSNDHRSAGMGLLGLAPVVSGAVCAAIAYAVGHKFCNRIKSPSVE